MTRPILHALLAAGALAAGAGRVAAQDPSAATGSVTGLVYDSIAGGPLREALVQLDSRERGTSRSAATDSLGWFTVRDLPPGRYTVGFLHPVLDSLGVEAPLRQVTVEPGAAARVELGVPSPSRIRAAVCGASAADSSAVVIGTVRNAVDHAPVPDATVSGEWLEYMLQAGQIGRRVPRLVATTGPNGWFALCNVPRGGTVALRASRGGDSTDLVEVMVPESGFLRRELYVGGSQPGDVRTGGGRLSGAVLSAEGGQPLAGAEVRILGGTQVRTNERGEWTLTDAPAGTRTLEIRALGFYPERRAVDVVDGAPAVRVTLNTMRAVLDTVLVTARRTYDQSGFLERRRNGAGRYMTADEIQRRNPLHTSDVFRWIPGLEIERDGTGAPAITMRGLFTARCTPAVFVDGTHLRAIAPEDLDGWVDPRKIKGIEVYSAGMAPAQFVGSALSDGGAGAEAGCGVVAVWTR